MNTMQAKDSKHRAFSHCASGSLRQSMTRQSCISAMKKIKKGLSKKIYCCCCFESLTHRYRYKHARLNMNVKSHIRMEKFFTIGPRVLDVKLQKKAKEATLLCPCEQQITGPGNMFCFSINSISWGSCPRIQWQLPCHLQLLQDNLLYCHDQQGHLIRKKKKKN